MSQDIGNTPNLQLAVCCVLGAGPGDRSVPCILSGPLAGLPPTHFRRADLSPVVVNVDVGAGQLLHIVKARASHGTIDWLRIRPESWRSGITQGTLDLSSAYRKVFLDELPHVNLVTHPFHVAQARRGPSSMRSLAESGTRRSGIEVARATRSIGVDGC